MVRTRARSPRSAAESKRPGYQLPQAGASPCSRILKRANPARDLSAMARACAFNLDIAVAAAYGPWLAFPTNRVSLGILDAGQATTIAFRCELEARGRCARVDARLARRYEVGVRTSSLLHGSDVRLMTTSPFARQAHGLRRSWRASADDDPSLMPSRDIDHHRDESSLGETRAVLFGRT